MYKLSKIEKRILCYLGLVMMFVLMGNSNNIADIFAERIFKPIKGNNGSVFYYSGLIVILVIYYCLKELNKIRENFLIRTTFRRIVLTIILMSTFPLMWIPCIQFYKGFSKDLNSVYLNREQTLVKFQGNEGNITVSGNIDVRNCSNDIQKFRIKVKAPSLVREDIKEDYITLGEDFKVYPKEEKTLFINEEFNKQNKYSGYSVEGFEYIFFNEKEEVVFKGKLSEYKFDDSMSEHLKFDIE